MSHSVDLQPSAFQTVGPFFHLGCIDTRSVSCLAGAKAKGVRIRLICLVLDGEGAPVPDAMIEIWQADAEGKYNHPVDWQEKVADAECSGFGRLATDENGMCVFETVKPGRVAGNDGGLQAPHLEISVFARGVLNRLVTRAYFEGDRANLEDPILLLVPAVRRATLMARADSRKTREWRFEIRLCGEDETVFFDV